MSTLPKHKLTAEEFASLPLEGLRSELIEGAIRTSPLAFEDHGEITMRLSIFLGHYVLVLHLGEMYAAETGFLLARNPDTVRAPDIAFIQQERLPAPRPAPRWVPVIPDLVVEVASSGDQPVEIRQKAAMWMDAGVRLVWLVLPGERAVEVYRAGEAVVKLEIPPRSMALTLRLASLPRWRPSSASSLARPHPCGATFAGEGAPSGSRVYMLR